MACCQSIWHSRDIVHRQLEPEAADCLQLLCFFYPLSFFSLVFLNSPRKTPKHQGLFSSYKALKSLENKQKTLEMTKEFRSKKKHQGKKNSKEKMDRVMACNTPILESMPSDTIFTSFRKPLLIDLLNGPF